MPAQTHNRVRNGFHILAKSRGRLTNLNKKPCDNNKICEKAYCCGPALQPKGMKPAGCKRGLCSFVPQAGRKRASALGGIGSRSAITKRVISRRVQYKNQMPPGYIPTAQRPTVSYTNKEWPTKNAICKDADTHGGCACCLTNIIT